MTATTFDHDQQTPDARIDSLVRERWHERLKKVDKMFAILMLVQWVFAVLFALFFSPYAWSGKTRVLHTHVYVALFMGAALTLLPVLLAKYRGGSALTRHVMAISQMLMSALLIHLTGGRIETHFHVFGSLAFLAFYLDWRVLITATVTVAGEHFLRGLLWPESIYGVTNPEWWRFLEHAFWVAFEDVILIWGCITGLRDMKSAAAQQVAVEQLTELEQLKTAALEMALAEFGATTA
ncbi:MAG TPA: hypothetical protein VE010_00640 [Thermoanaerobaculia bacterium]|nr:hypothetical protein [Thermoanaerobaculia bacterium]